jgi:23S rRNA (cytidine1920-2'-O)/16S rRNA (cytidine1409-2'-O)-methyltransferase
MTRRLFVPVADGVPIRKASDTISTTATIEASPEHPYVPRGGIKLAAALDHFHLDVTGRICLDVGGQHQF